MAEPAQPRLQQSQSITVGHLAWWREAYGKRKLFHFTGDVLDDVMHFRWPMLDHSRECAFLPTSKTGEPRVLPLPVDIAAHYARAKVRKRAINRLIVALLAGVFAFGPVSVCGEDEKQQATGKLEPSKSAETPKKDKAFKASTPQPLPTNKSWGVGDFPPYGGRTVDPWRQDEKRRKERLQHPTPKSTAPKSTDEERAERKRLVDEWEKTQQPAPK